MNGIALAGGLFGALFALVAYAPAAWLTGALGDASGGRLMFAEPRGTVWQGSAEMVLTGGPGSRDASVLPGRLSWTLGLDGAAIGLRVRQACCINGELRLRLVPGVGRVRIELPPPAQPLIGEWPASWLAGLGTPWNTLDPTGTLQLSSPGLAVERVQGRWRFSGRADLGLEHMASRVSTLETLGSYRLSVVADAGHGDAATIRLDTVRGPLQLSGSGQWAAAQLRFNGQASADPGYESALGSLLNIIGRRQGAVSLISIG